MTLYANEDYYSDKFNGNKLPNDEIEKMVLNY